MIGLVLPFLAGAIVCCFVPERYQNWVRAAWGWVWARVSPAPAPARVAVAQPLYGAPTLPPERVDVPRVIGNILAFGIRYWQIILLVALFVFVAGFFQGCIRLPFGESREHAVVRADNAEGVAAVTNDVAHAAIPVVNTFHATTNQIGRNLERGHAEIEAASHETSLLFLAWAHADQRMCSADPTGCGDHRA